jgi:hydrogenase/urease accessory protein HupE
LKAGEATTIDPSALASNLLRNVRDFLALGVVHIFEGIDHVLFILGLLLVSTSLRGLVKTLTGFTIAHSITLILSTLSVITPPARLVDTLVALSIVYVGLENILRNTADAKGTDHRFWIASGFGLVHGFAFATNLREAGLPEGSALFWSLLSFNVGVEIAQVTIAAAAFPLLLLWKRSTEQRQRYGGMPWTSVVRRRRRPLGHRRRLLAGAGADRI